MWDEVTHTADSPDKDNKQDQGNCSNRECQEHKEDGSKHSSQAGGGLLARILQVH